MTTSLSVDAHTRRSAVARSVALAAALCVVAAGCGGSSSKGATGSTTSSAAKGSTAPPSSSAQGQNANKVCELVSLDEVIAITGLQVTNTEGIAGSNCYYRIGAVGPPPEVAIGLTDYKTVEKAEERMVLARQVNKPTDITGVGEDALLHGERDIQGWAMARFGTRILSVKGDSSLVGPKSEAMLRRAAVLLSSELD